MERTNERAVVNQTRVRAYAVLVNDGKAIDEVREEYRVPVYVELIAVHDWTIEKVDPRYTDKVKAELGMSSVNA